MTATQLFRIQFPFAHSTKARPVVLSERWLFSAASEPNIGIPAVCNYKGPDRYGWTRIINDECHEASKPKVSLMTMQIKSGSFETLGNPPLCQVRRRPVGMPKIEVDGNVWYFSSVTSSIVWLPADMCGNWWTKRRAAVAVSESLSLLSFRPSG